MRLDRRSVLLGAGALAVGGGALAGGDPLPRYEDPDDMYAALRDQPHQLLDVAGGKIRVVFADDAPGLARQPVLDWIRSAGRAVSAYFGRYPVEHGGLLIIAEPGAKVGHATTFGYAGPATRIHVGTGAGADAFARDWVLAHEMVHCALPDLPRRALWLQEGNATYVEPIARAMVGQLAVTEVWRQALVGMRKGLPQVGDAGLDGTRVWGRLYWGGAIFWLLAEIAIYRDTRGARSLRDVLRHINRSSGGNAAIWEPEQLVAVGDRAIGGSTLGRLYARFANSRVEPDLDDVFRALGVPPGSDLLAAFNDRAPLARLRRQITAPFE